MQITFIRSILWTLAVGVLFSLFACEAGGGKNRAGTAAGSGTAPTTGTAETPIGKGTAASVTIDDLKSTTLFTKETAENTCAPFTVTTKDDKGQLVGDVNVKLTVQVSGEMVDSGRVTPESSVTDAAGLLQANYCSGESEGSVTIIAAAGTAQTNSSKIKVAKKPVYSFSYIRSDVNPALTPAEGIAADAGVLYLNLIDSGPQDCTNIYFKLTKSETPVVGTSILFSTQPDYPKGAKLGKRMATLATQINATTGQKSSIFSAISSGSGEFAVPVCAGVSLGTLVVSGTFTDEDGRNFTARSPVLRITAGLTNFINMSLTFDPINGRNLKGYFNTNSDYQLPITVQLGARQDGQPITDYPVFVATEVGKVLISNGGNPDKDKGTVDFKVNALHLVDNYPFMVNSYTSYPLAQTRCEPQELAAWATANAKTEVKFTDLVKNWRSTLLYGIRGQEAFHDANRNGMYDVGGDGFWDKNQNGYYDTGDLLTFDAGNDGLFNINSEWFIDLPSPFIDVDEDGLYSPTKDILIGDEYQAPNGKRDNDTLVWKREYLPVSMGASPYGLRRNRIQAANYAALDATISYGGVTYPVFGAQTINEAVLGVGSASANAASYDFAIFLHDLCGNMLAGGTKMEVDFVDIDHTPEWANRVPISVIYIQPGDTLLEPSRRFMVGSLNSSSSSSINFNAVDHPASAASYPVISSIEIPPCTRTCTGAVVPGSPGISCDGFSGSVRVRVTEPTLDKYPAAGTIDLRTKISYGAYDTCNCVTNAFKIKGTCECSNGRTFDGSSCVL